MSLPVGLQGSVLDIGVVAIVGLLVVTVLVARSIVVVDQHERYAYTVFGEYRGLLEPGVNVVAPFVSDCTRFDMREMEYDTPPQEVTVGDGTTVSVDVVVTLGVDDPETAFHATDDYRRAVAERIRTATSDVFGDLERADALAAGEQLDDEIERALIGPATEIGVRVEDVEIRSVGDVGETATAAPE